MAAKKKLKAKVSRAKAAVKKAVKKVAKKAAAKVQPIPKGYHSLTPSLVIKGAADALEFYKRAFDAKELSRMPDPTGNIVHAEMQIGDSRFMIGEEMPQMGGRGPKTLGGTPASVLIYTKDADALFNRAVAAGATVKMALDNQFWGDRWGSVTDPFGHEWQIATHKEDVSPAEMGKRAAAAFSGPPPG